ncbi:MULTISPECIES: DUF6634 family protein [Phyllobacteriaceae]|jgi:hypothetical protein|uniref:Uncharacterized protein n=1 Tax=Mesorhizobium hungaricum TaxID=1566387 RepID=A0A1C2DTA7_9HYPH|nr:MULTISPECIES: DUF6634 family protein [Mesorhizobium]MBN9236350.1 hypothetical protein [Mesorhizobium sp.]MDQ0327747.1 hypothetical protein [Mesorhizobium sp. YL-MeA3-2017]OCX17846.1 hypothetical protein QV13_14145 [Mesorhizobium hungaricum]
MLMFDPQTGRYDPRFEREADRLVTLAADMEKIRNGADPKELAAGAPILDHWVVAEHSVPYLAGLSSGHPILTGTGRLIATSDLVLVAHDQSWARTRSRFYRLGRPSGVAANS